MIANLSVVLDEKKEIRLDLLKNIPLSKIDEYTTLKTSSEEVRMEYKEIIQQFLETHASYISTFKKESNKKGTLVIIYQDERNRFHRMRVLYKEDINKRNLDKTLKAIADTIRAQKNPEFTIQLMKNFSFFLGSEFHLKQIRKIERFPSTKEQIRKNQNQRLLNLIRNKLKDTILQDQEKGYFYLRLIDAYLERFGFQTTKKVFQTKFGTIQTTSQFPKNSIVLKKETKYSKVEKEQDTYFLESDGQYALFDMTLTNAAVKEEIYSTYDRFLEAQEDSKRFRR